MVTRVHFHKLSFYRRGTDYVVSHEPTASTAIIEQEGKEIIEYLQKHSVEQTKKKYLQYDIDEFVRYLGEHGLIYSLGKQKINPKKHLADIFKHTQAKWAKHPIVLTLYATIFFLGAYFLAQQQFTPTYTWFFFTTNYAILLPVTIFALFLIQAIHELGHYLAMATTKHTTALQLQKRWFYLRIRANIQNIHLLRLQTQTIVYLAGIFAVFLVLSIALTVYAYTQSSFAQFIALLALLNILSQFIPHPEADIIKIANNKTGVDILRTLREMPKQLCIFCKQKNPDPVLRSAVPLLFIGFFVGLTVLIVYLYPIFATVGYDLIQQPLNPMNMLALLFSAFIISANAITTLTDHPYASKKWFSHVQIHIFFLSTYTITVLVLIPLLVLATLPAILLFFFTGIIYGALIRWHYTYTMYKEYTYPYTVLIAGGLLIPLLQWAAIQQFINMPITLYVIFFTIGMLVTTVLPNKEETEYQ